MLDDQADTNCSPECVYGQLVSFHEEQDDKVKNAQDHGDEQEILLYLIRHGEAQHNIEEKKAMENARRISIHEEGLSEDDPRVAERMEEARKAVLNDELLRDAKLSKQGRIEARAARDQLREWISQNSGLKYPNYVLVSPLTRTLETCAILFPDHTNIHVRQEIQERHTGKPPDKRSPVHRLSLRPSFQRFSMEQLQRADFAKERRGGVIRRSSLEGHSMGCKKPKLSHSHSRPDVFLMCDDVLSNNTDLTEEDKAQLRIRTETLFALLCEASSFSVAVVTHKG
jgi:phosphohistidine phosphatase SixA